MGPSLFTIKSYIQFKIRAKNAHGLHSPFIYDLYQETICSAKNSYEKRLKDIREFVFSSNEIIQYTDPKSKIIKQEALNKWAKRVTSSLKFSRFLIRLIDFLHAKTVLETGTAAGINAVSMTLSKSNEIITLEGSHEIASVAQRTIDAIAKSKVQIIEGDVRSTFASALQKHKPDLVFLDADHRSETIMFYMEEISKMKVLPQCILIHDIYWSKDMNQAWLKLVKNAAYPLTIDLFEVGLIFPHFPSEKQHFQIKF